MGRTMWEQLRDEIVPALAMHPGVNLQIDAESGMCIVGALQLALRYPDYTGSSRLAVEAFTRSLIERLAITGLLRQLLEAGFDPSFDETDAERNDPTRQEEMAAEVFARAERAEAQAPQEPLKLRRPEPELPPPGTRIREIWAYTSIDPTDDCEGIIGALGPDGWMPLICADEKRVRFCRPVAEDVARRTRRPVYLTHYGSHEVVETITP